MQFIWIPKLYLLRKVSFPTMYSSVMHAGILSKFSLSKLFMEGYLDVCSVEQNGTYL